MAGTEKIERLLNLVALLLETRRPLTVNEIRDKIPGYSDQSDDAFHRMFERDKSDVRELGFALEQEETDAWGSETGYRIPPEQAMLDDPGFAPDEIAALSLAAQAWAGGDESSLGLLKLSVGSGIAEPGSTGWVLPRVAFDKTISRLLDAIDRRKSVTFDYRTGGGGDAAAREVEPHRLFHRGTWYLSGYDRARADVRVFKLSRVVGDISVNGGREPDFETPDAPDPGVMHGPWEGEGDVRARVAFAPETAWWVERRTGATRIAERPDGWVELEMNVSEIDAFAGWVAGFAAGAVVLGPAELREAVVGTLRPLAQGGSGAG